ncbi:energy-coupling factor transporter transmembrane protein EcfT [Radiobacillus kanasensis]|uniref:energy-coupling factor transporter transmembrane component T family protein n=1 Tax=Radiobacillus kanasensis TaxID=2844358 RepID=UPI001E65965E|nr:energy-coupling factor transporter transmembrane component T [Radiobacillus kanasensis]UFT98330.1 energy-coupling factor transporter transmembrane protein EcfT [Radiobacillus kanasensis]
MAAEMLSYIDRKSPIHSLSGATKLICFILWSFAAMLTYDTRVLSLMFVLSIVIFTISKIRFKEVSFILVLILLFLLINNIAIYVFAPQQGVDIYDSLHVWWELPGHYDLTVEQLFYQLNITLKYFVVIPAALLFIVTTNPSEFASSLNRIGVSYRIAYAIAIALRYIPDIQRDYRTIALAQQARGIDLSRKEKLPSRIKNAVAIVIPLIFSSLDRIEVVSNGMELRGFGKSKKRTWYRSRPFVKADFVALGLFFLLFAVSLVVTFYDGSRFYNPF